MAAAIRSRQISPVEIVDALLSRIELVDPAIRSFITVSADVAREGAKLAEQQVMSNPVETLGRLHGVPISVKDLTPTAGVRTTFGVAAEANNIPTEDGLTWARLKAQGAILIGKTSTPPFGALCVTENDVIGRTNNPWNIERTVGGSSGGAAAALAAGLGPIATGSDGGGSIRVPSSFCGTVGLKPSRGRIPLYTEGPVFETVDVVGPMARNVSDCALMLSIMAGPHHRDPYALLDSGTDFLASTKNVSLRGLRVAMSMELGRGPVDAAVFGGVSAAATHFESVLGAHVDSVEMPMPDLKEFFMNYWAPVFTFFMGDEKRYDFSRYPCLLEWIEHGRKVSATDYIRSALVHREQIHTAFADVFEDHDVIVTPTTPVTAFAHPSPEHLGPEFVGGQRVSIPAIDFSRFTDPPSNAGFPAISIPCGFDDDGMPIGLQIIGKHGADAQVLAVASAFERSFPSDGRRPRLNTR